MTEEQTGTYQDGRYTLLATAKQVCRDLTEKGQNRAKGRVSVLKGDNPDNMDAWKLRFRYRNDNGDIMEEETPDYWNLIPHVHRVRR